MTRAPSQTADGSGPRSALLLPLAAAAAMIGGAFFVVAAEARPSPVAPVASAASAAPAAVGRPAGAPFEADLELRPEPPPPPPPLEIARADVEPRELGWLSRLPPATTFRAQSFAAATARRDEELALRWTMVDRGPARDASGALIGEEQRDRRYALDVSWHGETRTVALEASSGWPETTLASYCERRGWRYIQQSVPREAVYPYAPAAARLPELAVFAEGTFRGADVYRVLATPHAIHVLVQDTSPGDWIRACHEVHQGPFTECREMAWSLLATIAVELPSEVHVTEAVMLTEDQGPVSLACDAVSDMYEVLAPE